MNNLTSKEKFIKSLDEANRLGYFTTQTLSICAGVSRRQMQLDSESVELQRETGMWRTPGGHRHYDVEKSLKWLKEKDRLSKGIRFSVGIVDGYWLGHHEEGTVGWKNQWKGPALKEVLSNAFFNVDFQHYPAVLAMLLDFHSKQFRFMIVPSVCQRTKLPVNLLLNELKLEHVHLRGVFIEHMPGEERQYCVRGYQCFGSTYNDRLVTIDSMRVEQNKLKGI